MQKIEMYEPAMCCPTGVCGPNIDSELLEIAGIYEQINRSTEWEATRFNLAQDPQAFVDNGQAIEMIRKNGKKCLPITFVNGQMVKSGAYPSLAEFQDYTELTLNQKESV